MLEQRAVRHAALGDPVRLAIVDSLAGSDRAPIELGRHLGIGSNLLAHHLDVLEEAGLIGRSRSSGDGRRRYVHLHTEHLASLVIAPRVPLGRALFVCTANAARSQLAAALWCERTGQPASSAGTQPAAHVHPEAIAAAERAGLDLRHARPHPLAADADLATCLVVTVCDRAHEALDADPAWLHWSVPDPVPTGSPQAFDAVVAELAQRIDTLAPPPTPVGAAS